MTNKIVLVPFKRHNSTSIYNYFKSFFTLFEINVNYKKLIQNELVRVNGHLITDPQYVIAKGDFVEILSDEINQPVPPKLDIIYKDEDLCVINKDFGMHAVDSIYGVKWPVEDTLRWMLSSENEPSPPTSAVHRLDVDTSGVFIIALSTEAASVFGKALEKRESEKAYYAVVSPPPLENEFIVDEPIGYDTSNFGKWITGGKKAKEAKTLFSVEKKSEDKALLKCVPQTGRTHQIRVHLKHKGLPIIGDTFYGGQKAERLYLHCYSMKFPKIQEFKNSFQTPVPKEFLNFN
jgi:23S rRNA pseudouridine1911/1915/1917 synthase